MPIEAKLVRDHFLAAADLPAVERAAYLTAHCAADPELLAAVERLLAAHEQPASVLNQAAPARLDETQLSPPREHPGNIIAGRYKLLEAIGEGGMGTVWVAEQSEPVRRKVALKLIKAGMDSRTVLARFEAERQALAVMDHPNIAKVLDGGLTEMGRPFFVMEYVKGVPITEYCDARRLSVPERLALFTQVCQAVQHAHQKGIIHRDLKPSNILVAPYDDRPVPKVIDFGLAKAMHQSLTELTLHTAHDIVLGTPIYMSPEQAQLNNLDVDTRSDVYSLGVLLYELLTGSTPLEKKRFKAAAWDEVKRIIREEEPPRPSTRLSSSATLASLASGRQIEPGRLTKLIRGELDWIVMKALEKDRTRRYETATGFAADVQRYLDGEPVTAHPPTFAYSLQKAYRKHRAAVRVAAAFVCLTLVAATMGLYLAVRATNAEAAALAALSATEHQRTEAEALAKSEAEQRAIADKQRKDAEKARDRTRDVLDAMTSSVTGDSLSSQKEISPEQQKFLNEVLSYYREFAGENADVEQSRARTAKAAGSLGLIEGRLGRKEQGIAALQMASDAYKSLAAEFPNVAAYREELANSQNNLGALLADLGKQDEALEQFRQGLSIREKLAVDFPDDPQYRRHLAGSHGNFGLMLARLRRGAEAEEHYQKSLAIWEKLLAEIPAAPDIRGNLAVVHHNLADLLVDRKPEEAEKHCRQAIAIMEQLVADFPAVPDYRNGLAGSHSTLGSTLSNLDKGEEAEQHSRQALAILEKLAADYPSVQRYQIDLGGIYCNYANWLNNAGRPDDSLPWYDKAIATLEPVHRAEPREVTARQYLRNSHGGRADTYAHLKNLPESDKDWARVIELTPPPQQAEMRARRAMSRAQAGLLDVAVAEIAELTKSSHWTADHWHTFARVYVAASSKVEGKQQEYTDRAIELLQKAIQADPSHAPQLKQDPDLAPLREREDFRKLIGELKAGSVQK